MTGTDKTQWTQLAINAAKSGDYETSVNLFVTAISHDQRNAGLRYNLAISLERNGEIDDAAVSLTDALRLKPDMLEAANRLARLLSKYEISEPARLDAAGLMNAMSVPGAATESIGAMAISILKIGGPLFEALQNGALTSWDETADALLKTRTAPLLRDPLFLRALTAHVNSDGDVEHLLMALRRTILQLPAERFTDKAAVAFAIALAKQCLQNEHVFETTEGERALLAPVLERAKLKPKMDPASVQAILVSLLYENASDVLSPIDASESLATLKPKTLRAFLMPLLAQHRLEQELVETVKTVGRFADATSSKVAAQYEDSPYPRWSTFRPPLEAVFSKVLSKFVLAERLSFMAQPFDVLIAGCGTGRQALEASIGYGPNARLTAIDISRRSLAYAMREARARNIRNVSFLQADLLDETALRHQYDVIECVGVLHHLEHPLDGLRALERRLKPGGIMQIALYSAVSREELSELRHEAEYPGAGCDADAARRYRALLRDRSVDETGGELTISADFWSLSGFRDLVLHVSEQQFILPDIKTALDDLGLTFRGFTLHPQTISEFSDAYPNDPWPGSLENWWAWEQENPRLFDGMYSFWVEKPAI